MGADADPHLLDKLTGELDAITSRALDALGQLINRNGKFTRPRSSIAALEEWRLENNHLADFVAERLYEDPQASLSVQVTMTPMSVGSGPQGSVECLDANNSVNC